MNTTDLTLGNRPMSAKELTDKAGQFDWNPHIGFKYWARAAETIHHEGQVYLREGNVPQAYLVLFRYSVLVLEYLAKHPEAKEPESRRAIKPLQKRIPRVLEVLETLRPEIEETYDQWRKISAAEEDSTSNARLKQSSPYAKHAAKDPALSWSYVSPANILDVDDHQDLAVDLAKKEMRRRRRAAGITEEEEQKRRGGGDWGHWNPEPERRIVPQFMDDDELRRQMEATRRQLDRSGDYQKGHGRDDDSVRPATYYYPTINKSSPLPYERPEMCGMLCGTTVNNALFISHLVIPEQKCTSDTCETENESVMLDFCIENDLIVIGWIHTHPTQTCFMSSRDLHTQAGYQVMMPESIAIVCAPRHEPSFGIFRLTNPPGLPHILSCQRSETFHQHTVDNLYVEAGHPQGHVYESKTLEFDVCDLRPGQ
ncbi:hypothetical protein N0V88_007736 [Collariella sp. IMI 366227]|nr:hypothetical protein N0V88_007736 [Collariella sp. IMI 366227]